MDVRLVRPDEMVAFGDVAMAAFHAVLTEADREHFATIDEPERMLVVADGDALVATAAAAGQRITVPDGELGCAAVTGVTVSATHRRRGLLTAMMSRQLQDVRDRGEPLAALLASEGSIYGRYGYAPASFVMRVRARRGRARLAREAEGDPLRVAHPDDVLDHLRAVHAAERARRAGMLDRGGPWWAYRLFDPEHARDGAVPLRAVVAEDGYALYAVASGEVDDEPAGEVRVRELVAGTPAARARLWAFLLDLDLTDRVVYAKAPEDEPLPLVLSDPTAARMERRPGLWLRLVDVPAALAGRGYATDPDVVLEVTDAFCPWNAGRWRLAAGVCEPTDARADLALDVASLAAAYLGGVTLDRLAVAGLVEADTAAALARASAAFATPAAPWSPDAF